MNAILGVYTTLDEFTDLQCDYVDQVVKCERLEKELSKSKITSKSFEALQQHAINLELALQQYLKAQLQDKGIAISELKKLIEKMKGKSVETKFEKPLVIRKPNAFKSQRQSVLGKLATFSDSLAKTDFSKSKLPQDIWKTNKRVSFSTRVIPTTSDSKPQLKSNQLEDRVMHNNSEGKKQQVEDHRRNFKKCVNDDHNMCVLYYINGVNSRTKMPMVVPISTREPKRTMNQSVATTLRRTVASESTNQKPRSTIRNQYKQISNTCKWWYPKFTPSGYKWKPKSPTGNVNTNVTMPLENESRTANIL
ncbi:hypothetical protein Tco_1551150, partial [Tanacetum coccineum]